MHILAALTDGPLGRVPAPQTKGVKPEGDFEAAFLSAGDIEVINEEGLIPDTPELEPEVDSDALAEDELLEPAETSEAPELEPDSLELHATETEAPIDVPPDTLARYVLSDPDTPTGTLNLPDSAGVRRTPGIDMPAVSTAQGLQHSKDTLGSRPELPMTAQQVSQTQTHMHNPAATHSAPFAAHPSQLSQSGTEAPDFMPTGRVALRAGKEGVALNSAIPMTNVPAKSKQEIALAIPLVLPKGGNPSRITDSNHVPHPELSSAGVQQRHTTAVPLQNVAPPVAQAFQQHVQKLDGPSTVKAMEEVKPVTLGDEIQAIAGLARTDVAQAQPVGAPPTVQHPAIPQHVARQMAEALQQGGNGPVDVALNPEELGRVRMRITLQEGGIVINILAERAETLDLMRRNADLLGQEFKELGFGTVSFGFSASAQDEHPEGRHGSDPHQDPKTEPNNSALAPDTPVPAAQTHVTQGVDIRL